MKVAVCAIAKLENKYLKEWVEHYKNIGFDNVILFDNNYTNGEKFDEVIKEYIDCGFVIVENLRGKANAQCFSYNLCYKKYSNYFDWIAFFDIDEFLHLKGKSIKEYLSNQKFANFNCVKINWKIFDDNNLIRVFNSNFSIGRFTNATTYLQEQTKSILKTKIPNITINSPHGALNEDDVTFDCNNNNKKYIKACNAIGEPCDNVKCQYGNITEEVRLYHYWFKTIEEYTLLKAARGYPNDYANFGKDFFNINTFFDYNKKTKEKLDYYYFLKNVFLQKKNGWPISCYRAFIEDEKIRAKSSSGGIFYSLAEHIINKGGIVFSAKYNSNWETEMSYVDNFNGLDKLMESKCVIPKTGDSFSNAKRFLDDNKPVLYVATPCVINKFKSFLKKEYKNLICVDSICPGAVPTIVWKDYLKSVCKKNNEISEINMQFKQNGNQKNCRFKIVFKNGKVINEPFKCNSFMKLFLSNHYFHRICYNCPYKNYNSMADLTIGDCWNINESHGLNDENISSGLILINSENGRRILSSLHDINKFSISYLDSIQYNSGLSGKIYDARYPYSKDVFNRRTMQAKKRIAIMTLPLQTNIDDILQTFALSEYLKKLNFDVDIISGVGESIKDSLPFVFAHLNIICAKDVFNDEYDFIEENQYRYFIVSGDQILRRDWINVKNVFLHFSKKYMTKRIMYAGSFGNNVFSYSETDKKIIKELLPLFSLVSIREFEEASTFCNLFGIKPNIAVDPTLLLTKNDYTNLCKGIGAKDGIFAYILDDNEYTDSLIKKASDYFKTETLQYNKQILETWLAAFRDAKFIITDSYHGCLFSIIFDKPFLCIVGKERDNNKFKNLEKMCGMKERFIYNKSNSIDFSILAKPILKQNTLISEIERSKEILNAAIDKDKQAKQFITNLIFVAKKIIRKIFPASTKRGVFIRKMWKNLKKHGS